MFGECHAHMLMDGIDYREAVKLHRESVCESKIREYFEAYRRAGVSFVRDGGDNCGVSRRAAQIAGEYGIDYRTDRKSTRLNSSHPSRSRMPSSA